jgi:hypothetical protein
MHDCVGKYLVIKVLLKEQVLLLYLPKSGRGGGMETCPSGSDDPGKKKMVGEKANSALLSFLALAFSSSVAHADDHHGRGHVGGGSRDSGKGHNRVKQYLEELLYNYLTVGRL